MKLSAMMITALLALGGTVTAASAIEFDVGPGGVRVGPGYRYHDHDYGYRYGDRYDHGCRVVIDRHTNRYGEDVTVRRRVCD
jgi:hypothetical protein